MDLNSIFNITITIILGLVAYLYRQSEQKIKDVENENKEIKDNYLTRFEDVNRNINNLKLEILESLNDLKIQILEKNNK